MCYHPFFFPWFGIVFLVIVFLFLFRRPWHRHWRRGGDYYGALLEKSPENILAERFAKGEINFYIAAIKLIEEPLDEVYDWTADIMSDAWDADAAFNKLRQKPNIMICDALLDQNIFAGSGNIIKNEALFRAKIHPESLTGEIPDDKLRHLINTVVDFSADFLKWRAQNQLTKHLEAYEKDVCPRNHIPFTKKDTGKTKRHSYFCTKCQELFN